MIAPHQVLVVSDGTGMTGERVIQAALTQFDSSLVTVERIPNVRNSEAIRRAISLATERGATVLFSLVSPEQRRDLLEEARLHEVDTIDLLGPILRQLSEVLAVSPRSQPGIFHQLDQEYFARIEAIDYVLRHDDGKRTDEIGTADLVLVGVSRTSKTPLSVYLANRGWRVANVPIVLGHEPPAVLFELPRERTIALTARQSWLESVRRHRVGSTTSGITISYSDPDHVREELAWFRRVLQRGKWRVLDVTNKAIEETASEVVSLVRG